MPTAKTDQKLWDPMPGESPQAHRAFRAYLDLGAGRSLDAVADGRAGRPKGVKRATPGRLSQWSRDWRWVARARAYDAHAARVEDQARDRQRARRAADRERRRETVEDEEWLLAGQLKVKALRMLQWPLERTETTTTADGKTITTVIEPADWRLRDAVGMLKLACDLARLAVGLPVGRQVAEESAGPQDQDPGAIPPDLAEAWRDLAARKALEHAGLDPGPPE